MNKIKDGLMKQQEEEFELELSYQEWLRDNFSEPSECELNKMEQDFLQKPHYLSSRIITHKALNNTFYIEKVEHFLENFKIKLGT